MSLSQRAAQAAERQLAAALPRRWRHVQAVAQKAAGLRLGLSAGEQDVLTASAWLHDVGYAPHIADTGFHALDGARWVLNEGFGYRLAGLVAYHSCALYEAEERGLDEVLGREFASEYSDVSDALWFSDMTTGPDGQDLTVAERLAEIRERYGPGDLVTRFWRRAEPPLLEAVRRTQARALAQPM